MLDLEGGREIKRPLEDEGVFQGHPADSEAAIEGIAKLRQHRATHLVQTWEAFWWQSRYDGIDAYMGREARCLIANDCCRIFEFVTSGEPA
jgi:hypothetical protein